MVRPAGVIRFRTVETGRVVHVDDPASSRLDIHHRQIPVCAVEVPIEHAPRGGQRRPAALAELLEALRVQVGDAGLGPWIHPGREPAVGGHLKVVDAHRRVVPGDLARRRVVDRKAPDGGELPVGDVRSGKHPLTAVVGVFPDAEGETVAELPAVRPVPVDDENLRRAWFRTSGIDDAVAGRRDERLHVGAALAHDHALPATVVTVEPHQDEAVADRLRVFAVLLHPDNPRVSAAESADRTWSDVVRCSGACRSDQREQCHNALEHGTFMVLLLLLRHIEERGHRSPVARGCGNA